MSNKNQTEQQEELVEQEEQDEVDAQVEELENRLEEAENKYRRALADYQNLQKRVQDERIELIRSANKDLLLRILQVLDTLMLAQQHVQDKNIEVSINHFLDILKAEGVTRIKTVGEDFDPEVMEAIAAAEGEEGKVVSEVRAGFMLNDKLLRASQVTVGKESN
jgi:molecular chaperone GrpE